MALLLLAVIFGTATAEPAPQQAEKPKLICREKEQQTGSHIRTGKVCKTAEQWQIDDAALERASPSARVTEGQQDGQSARPPT